MALIKNFGIAGIGQSVQYGKGGGKVVYDTSNSLFKITKTNPDGSTVLSNLAVLTPESDDHAANKSYVDSVAQGLDVKESVRAASTGDITITSPTGQIDGVTLAQGDRILLKDQATKSQNGIWVFTSAVVPLVRAIDMDATGEFTGSFFFVEEGTVNSDQGFVCTTNGTVDLDLGDTVEFAQFTGTGQLTAGDGLSKVGNKIDVNVDDTFVKINANDQLTIKGSGVAGQVLQSTGSGEGVTFDALSLSNVNAITGVLPLANGGLGVNASDLTGKGTARDNLGLGSMATQNANAVEITGGSISFLSSGELELRDNQISGDKIQGGIIDGANLTGGAEKYISGYDITVGVGKKLTVTGELDVDGSDGSAMDNVIIGGTVAAAGTFSELNSIYVTLGGGTINSTEIGTGLDGAAAGTFTQLNASAGLKANTVQAFTADGDITFNSKIIAAEGIDFGGASVGTGGITADTIDEKTLNAGVTVDGVLLKDDGVTATGTSNLTTATIGTATINGGTIVDTTIGGATTSAAGTFESMTSANVTINGGSITNTNVNVVGKELQLSDNQISGDKIDGGVISDFASQGIDDNVTPLGTVEDGETRTTTTILTLEDAGATFHKDVTVTGNLTVEGTMTTVNSEQTLVKDNLITLNAGEAGPGVTSGFAGIEVDRGIGTDNASLQWNEADDVWEFKLGEELANLKIGSQAMDSIAVNAINELTPGNDINFGNDIAGTNATFSGTVTVDTISELNAGAGVTAAGVIMKEGVVTAGLTAPADSIVNLSLAELQLEDDQISGDKVEGGTIDAITITAMSSSNVAISGGNIGNTIIGANATSAAGTFTTLGANNVTLTGGTIDGTVIGGGEDGSAAGTFTTMTTVGAAITGGSIIGTEIGAGLNNSAAGTFNTLTSGNAQISGGAITDTSLTSNEVTFGGGTINLTSVGMGTGGSAEGKFSTLTSSNVNLTGGTANLGTVTATNLNSGNVTIQGGSISGTSIDLSGQSLTLTADSVSGNSIHAGTISHSSLLGITHNAEDPTHSTISKYDITVGSNFTLDVSAGTLALRDDQISGNFIDGGVISDFASTGIDDNANSTKMTLTDTVATFGVEGNFGSNKLTAGETALESLVVSGNATFNGNLTVAGTVTTTLSETVTIVDNMIELNSNADQNTPSTVDSGIEVNRGSSDNAKWYWDELNDVWTSKDVAGVLANISVGEIQASSFGLSGTIARTDGGTGTDTSTFADDSLMKMAGSGTVAELAKGAESTVLKVNSSGNLGYAKVELGAAASDVNGVLPLANGGTGLSGNGLVHQVLIADTEGALAYGYQDTLRTSLGNVAIQTSGMGTTTYLDMSNAASSVTLTAKNASGSGVVDMYLQGQGGGDVFLVGSAGEAVLQGDDDTDLTVSGGVSVNGDAGDLVLKGGNGGDAGISGDVIIKGGTGGTTEGKTQVYGSNDTLITTFVETASAVDSLEIKNGTGGIELAAVGDSAEVNLVLAPKTTSANGTGGMVMLPQNTVIDFDTSDDMVVSSKKYVDDEIAKVGDNFMRRDFTANGSSTFDIGTIKDVSGKDYYVKSVTIKILTAFVGCDEITVSGGGNTFVSPLDVDMSETGLYIIEQGYENTTAQNTTISAALGLGGSPVSPGAGDGRAIISVEYKAINAVTP